MLVAYDLKQQDLSIREDNRVLMFQIHPNYMLNYIGCCIKQSGA